MSLIYEILKTLGRKDNDTHKFVVPFEKLGCEVAVDLANSEIIYPESDGMKVNDRALCSLDDDLSVVAFDCVWRLLATGYFPLNLELAPDWAMDQLAPDIGTFVAIKDNRDNPLVMVECMKHDDDFFAETDRIGRIWASLFMQDRRRMTMGFICQYSVGMSNEKIARWEKLISLREKPRYLEEKHEDRLRPEGRVSERRFEIYWKMIEKNALFENRRAALAICKPNWTYHNLNELEAQDVPGLYGRLETILRQNNVSGRENAFDKLVNLIIAKLADEMLNPNSLQVCWRGHEHDDFYKLNDRLQRLHREGMRMFLGEEVMYVEFNEVKNAFRMFKNDRDFTQRRILKYFMDVKFHTNKTFAFIDVYNMSLFEKNSMILIDIIRLLQDIRLTGGETNRYRGELIDVLQNLGIRQGEGQYFTPAPIAKFLVSALPLRQLVERKRDPLVVVDFACGTGQLLNECAKQISQFSEESRIQEYVGNIAGIEREYRLSKVAKVSAILNGLSGIAVACCDALTDRIPIRNGSVDVLVSNPPKSVRGFLETLSENDRNLFEISEALRDGTFSSFSSIETFYMERAKQLLAPGGVAAVVMPSSLLYGIGPIYTKTREIMLQFFDIIAIVELGIGTFEKTETQSVALFLRRKKDNPSIDDHLKTRVNAWFSGDFSKDDIFKDFEQVEYYCGYIKIDTMIYKNFMISGPDDGIMSTEIFKEYLKKFNKLKSTKDIRSNESFKTKEETERQEILDSHFAEYTRMIERDKLYFFLIAYSNPCWVAIVKSPQTMSDMKKLLGYEWAGTKGKEGIKYIVDNAHDLQRQNKDAANSIDDIKTPLFDPKNLNSFHKINTVIRDNFKGKLLLDSDNVVFKRLIDLLYFKGADMNKAISLSNLEPKAIHYKYFK